MVIYRQVVVGRSGVKRSQVGWTAALGGLRLLIITGDCYLYVRSMQAAIAAGAGDDVVLSCMALVRGQCSCSCPATCSIWMSTKWVLDFIGLGQSRGLQAPLGVCWAAMRCLLPSRSTLRCTAAVQNANGWP